MNMVLTYALIEISLLDCRKINLHDRDLVELGVVLGVGRRESEATWRRLRSSEERHR